MAIGSTRPRPKSSTIPPAKWSTPANAGDETTIPLQLNVWHSAGYQLDSTDADRNMPDGLAAASQFMPAAGPGQWVWCHFDEAAGIWVMLQPFEDIIRVQLAEDWYACDSATANILIANGDADEWLGFATGYAVTAYDPLGTIANDPLSLRDSSGNCYMPARTCAILKRFADDNAWEPLRFMPGQCASGSGSAGSGSGTPPCTPPAGATCSYVEARRRPRLLDRSLVYGQRRRIRRQRQRLGKQRRFIGWQRRSGRERIGSRCRRIPVPRCGQRYRSQPRFRHQFARLVAARDQPRLSRRGRRRPHGGRASRRTKRRRRHCHL